ncbi:hypothetical protein CHH59_21470 [Shouchella clausii]|uniref:Uncharacterized protein n=1 Tax=Shouchella clausii TaxID=79880 RepID=A0A268NUD6_SHOCL|nr:hypothetical protein [Shouchella clausii]PAE86655.1 hypothetical protein CHH72_22350 [Shouchella clausii]PAF11841.1 hypothetical protein CHH59_21470 [Shouchella clausii]
MATKNKYPNHYVILKNEDGTLSHEKVIDIVGDLIETENVTLSPNEVTKYVNNNGGLTYITNINFDEMKEAHNLKQLRRSVVLTRLFDYDKEKPIAWGTIGAFAVAIIAIMFS